MELKNTDVLNVSMYFWPNSHWNSIYLGTLLTLSLTSSCSRCAQKPWWGWAGWGWRQILPPHRHNATLGEGRGGEERGTEEPWATHFWFISGKWGVGEANREQAVNHKSSSDIRLVSTSGLLLPDKVKLSSRDLWPNNVSGGLCCPPAGVGGRCTAVHLWLGCLVSGGHAGVYCHPKGVERTNWTKFLPLIFVCFNSVLH